MSAQPNPATEQQPNPATTQEADELELAALIASKICHDVIGPVGAIYNGLEVLDEDGDEQTREYAMNVIRSFTEQASAKLQFARFAFGAAGSAGAQIDLMNAHTITQGMLDKAKYSLDWNVAPGQMPKNPVKLLLNLVTCAISCLPKGGNISVTALGPHETPNFEVRCTGSGARVPRNLLPFLAGDHEPALDALNIQPYYMVRLAHTCGMWLTADIDGEDAVLRAVQRP